MTPQERLSIAIFRKDAEGVKEAIKDGADVNCKIIDTNNIVRHLPVDKTIIWGTPRILDILIKAGAKINKSEDCQTALHKAASLYRYAESFCTMLLEGGACVNAKDSVEGDTPLHHAAGAHNEGVIYLLLDYGARVNERDCWGRTPLHMALESERKHDMFRIARSIEVLLSAGADPDMRDYQSRTPRYLVEGMDPKAPGVDVIKALFK